MLVLLYLLSIKCLGRLVFAAPWSGWRTWPAGRTGRRLTPKGSDFRRQGVMGVCVCACVPNMCTMTMWRSQKRQSL